IFPHIMPRRYFDRMLQVAPPGMALQKRMSGIPVLVDVELRLRIMDRYDGYVQVLTLANPPIEVAGSPDASPELARLANDGMAEIVAPHPHPLPGLLPSPSENNPAGPGAENRCPDAPPPPARRADLHHPRGRPARSPRVPADLRPDGAARPADLDASGAARRLRRLRRGKALEVRHVVGVRL